MNTPSVTSTKKQEADMTLTTTQQTTHRRHILIAGVSVVILALLAAGANPVIHAVTGHTIGELIAQHDGDVVYAHYDATSTTPTGELPTWFPREATAITIARPGSNAGDTDATRIDATVSTGTPTPATCKPSSGWSMPFTVPNDWPTFRLRDLRSCDHWTLATHLDHWYLWEDQTSVSSAN